MRCCLTLVLVFACAWSLRSAEKEDEEAFKPYTPSRIQWLTVELNSSSRIPFRPGGFGLQYLNDGNEVVIRVRHSPNISTFDRKEMNAEINTARKGINIFAKARNWDWVRIREDVESY